MCKSTRVFGRTFAAIKMKLNQRAQPFFIALFATILAMFAHPSLAPLDGTIYDIGAR